MEIGPLDMVQQDGRAPTILVDGSAPGESGVSILNIRFDGGMHLLATPRCHCISFCFLQTPPARVQKRMAGRLVCVEGHVGMLSTYPAGIDVVADADEGVDILVVAIDPGRLVLAAADSELPEAQLIERISGDDPVLLGLARALASESAHNYPNGPCAWNEAANSFVDRLVAGHTAALSSSSRGALGNDQLRRLREYIIAHLDEPIAVEALAEIDGRSPFHFTRIFARSVGMTPHRYIVHLRLQRAIELVREGRSGLAEIAARTGFADQSHLSRWVRRVHGVSLSRFTA